MANKSYTFTENTIKRIAKTVKAYEANAINLMASRKRRRGSTATKYDGQFALSIDSDDVTKLIVGLSRDDTDVSTIEKITIGTTVNDFDEKEELTISEDCFICYKFVTDASTYTLEAETAYPTQDKDTLWFVIGYVKWDIVNSKIISVKQMQYGNIHYSARFI